ncbi:MAG: cellobiose phosphorylase, partial [Candidatus Omnitrophica bacterium]|nr:cellobiose phosphorylase [Candidatus Omnitrophota bacterium]
PGILSRSFERTARAWQDQAKFIETESGNKNFDNWLRWVSIQPILRKIFGCSFLPDFDYGKGGRGWRDLWQDCLSLILRNPKEVRPLIINNFSGVRIDGSNATVIGKKPGEFIADRNNISRIWMDHGIWPLLTTLLYINQTGDLKIILEETAYFSDHQLSRGREIDRSWSQRQGKSLKTSSARVYKGTLLEHILIQNLVQFFNVGPHNHIRLENADWNDGLDMAAQHGESVAFSAMYAQNLKNLCRILAGLKIKNALVFEELKILLDSLAKNPLNYSGIKQKQRLLDRYFAAVKHPVSGRKLSVPVSGLIRDLERKADWLNAHIQKKECLREGFFNGY